MFICYNKKTGKNNFLFFLQVDCENLLCFYLFVLYVLLMWLLLQLYEQTYICLCIHDSLFAMYHIYLNSDILILYFAVHKFC